MDWLDGDNPPVRVIECQGRDHGTCFAIHSDEEATWFVTCAHVIDHGQASELKVGGREAQFVVDGRDPKRANKIDLALLKVPGLHVRETLRLARGDGLGRTCVVPGWYKYGEKAYRGGRLDGRVAGDFPRQEEDSALVARAFEISLDKPRAIMAGYSGSPAICEKTREVFAVVTNKDETGAEAIGTAICISFLREIWTDDLPDALRCYLSSTELGEDFEQSVRSLFRQSQDVSADELRSICRRSSFPNLGPRLPSSRSLMALVDWLLERRQYANQRHPLYDVLAYLRDQASNPPLAERIERAIQQVADHHPGLLTTPLPPKAQSQLPTLVEITLHDPTSSESKGVDIKSQITLPGVEQSIAGPVRDTSERKGLDLSRGDHLLDLYTDLLDAFADTEVSKGPYLFLFRVTRDLLLHPFDQWPVDEVGLDTLGMHQAVAVCLDKRRGEARNRLADARSRITARLSEHLKRHLKPVEADDTTLPPDPKGRRDWRDAVSKLVCPVLTQMPPASDSIVLLLLINAGNPIALWPRTKEAETSLVPLLKGCLGNRIVADLPFAIHDQRANPSEEGGDEVMWSDLTLMWDDPLDIVGQRWRRARLPGTA